MSQRYPEKNLAITGIGQSAVSRAATQSALELTVDACLEAIADAGLKRADIDGVATWPGDRSDGSGFSPVGCAGIQDALRLELTWYAGGGEAPGQYGAVFNAIGAVAAGLAKNVLIFRTLYEATERKKGFANSLVKQGGRQSGNFAWYAPYYNYAAALQQSLYFSRYVHHAYGAVHESCVQLWGRGEARQVKGDPRVVATATAGGPLAGCMLLVRDDP